MGVKVRYKGYDLEFASYPSAEEILQAYDEFRQAVRSCTRQDHPFSIPRATRGEGLPLSFIQEALWLQEDLHPGSAAYNLPAAVRLSGDLDVAALERSLAEVVRRHEALRTRFPLVNGRPVQVVSPPQPLTLPQIDFTQLEPAMQGIAVQEAVSREAAQAFSLEDGPLLRNKLLKLSADEHVVLLTVHHIVFDAWSAGILLQELAALYETYSTGGDSALPELPLQYADFAQWQREQLTGETLNSMIDYWREQLAGAPALLQIPSDFPRPPKIDPEGTRYFFHLPPELTAKLKQLAGQEKVTLFTLLLAAFLVLLTKYSGQDDIVVGIPVAGRGRPELENLIGCFINTLAFRTRVKMQTRFREFLHLTEDAIHRTFRFQELPFEKVIKALAPQRHPSYSPVYQVLFDFVNKPVRPVKLSALTMSPIAANTRAVKMDLVFDMWEAESELAGQIEYRTTLFKEKTIAALARSFELLLENIAATADARLADLEMRADAEIQQELAVLSQQQKLNRQKITSIRPKAIKI